MKLTPLLNLFKTQHHLHNKVVAVFGEGACEIKEMEDAIKNGFTSDNLVLGASNPASPACFEYAHITLSANGRYLISSDAPHTGIADREATDIVGAIKAASEILNTLLKLN